MEFALDNVQTLKLRKEKLQYQQQAPNDENNRNENDKPDNAGGGFTHGKDRKRKSQDHEKPANESEQDGKVASGKSPQGGKFKKQKDNPKSTNTQVLSSKGSPKDSSARKLSNNQDGRNHSKNTAIDRKKDDVVFGKRKMQNQEQAGEQVTRKRAKKNKDSVGKDTVDKLDMLIEQYRSKFSNKGSQGNDGERRQSKQLRKWFQT